MQLPILSFEGLDLMVFATGDEAEGHVEPPDVDVGRTYDAVGQVLRFGTDGRRVFLHETGEYDADSLRAAILATFEATGVQVAAESPLAALVATATERFAVADQLTWLGRVAARFLSDR